MPTMPEMGEYLVGAYLKAVEGCDLVDYNVRPPTGGTESLSEFDVIGYNFETSTAFLCEVSTHIRGLHATSADTLEDRSRAKLRRQRQHARNWLGFIEHKRFMFWSPVVRSGLMERLERIRGLELVVNGDYSAHMKELQEKAELFSHDINNPAFRVLQILAHMR